MICINCIHLESLKRFVAKEGVFGKCQYCGIDGVCVAKDAMFDYIGVRIKESFRTLDELTSYERGMFFYGSDNLSIKKYWEIVGDDYDIGGGELVEDLIEYLEVDFALDEEGDDLLYALDDGSLETNSFEAAWEVFVSRVHHEHRFFNDGAKNFLGSLFGFTCQGGNLKADLITVLSDGDSLFRARKADNFEKLKKIEADPARELGPAPNILAGSQRMTPSGISAMYCATDRQTCLSEIRAVTGDLVVSAEFTPVTSMRFLDLRKLEVIARFDMSPFDEGFTKASHAYQFLKGLIFKLSKPKGSGDEVAYISTQVVFEYLRIQFNKQVSGIVFPSVQTGGTGTNIVLFPECTLVAQSGYSIESEDPLGGHDPWGPPIPTIQFKVGSARVHKIKAVVTESQDYVDATAYYISEDPILSELL
ncbi:MULTISPECIES: RES domain-containing protein [Pseudomonas]|uniref:RES domain-containing protein n=1 Tax=Pseudomonas TaxID=286 RepID=UPI000CD57391|nr:MULTISPECIES: RES domain-containing protein [Pseudomonas]RBH53186.1 RES domain-containing protein [Pseudomonas sp. MWU13-2860]